MMLEIPKSVSQGSFNVFGVEVHCYVLDNGQRIIEKESMENLFAAMESPEDQEVGDLPEFLTWIHNK